MELTPFCVIDSMELSEVSNFSTFVLPEQHPPWLVHDQHCFSIKWFYGLYNNFRDGQFYPACLSCVHCPIFLRRQSQTFFFQGRENYTQHYCSVYQPFHCSVLIQKRFWGSFWKRIYGLNFPPFDVADIVLLLLLICLGFRLLSEWWSFRKG